MVSLTVPLRLNLRAMAKSFPDFLIVGAAKCGSSMLHATLAQHPQLCVSSISEPGFFAGDNPKIRSLEEYRSKCFSPLPDQLCGEASTNNLYVPAACDAIRVSSPEAKIVVLVRRPWDAVFAWYHQLRRYRDDLPEFTDLVQSQIRQGRVVDTAPLRLLFDLDRYVYTPQVLRFVNAFGGDRVCVVSFHDLVSQAGKTVCGITEFLGVAPLELPHRPQVVNPHMESSSQLARSVLAWVNGVPNTPFLQTLLNPKLRATVRRFLMSSVYRPAPKPPFPERALPVLKEYYAADLRALASEFGVVLSDGG